MEASLTLALAGVSAAVPTEQTRAVGVEGSLSAVLTITQAALSGTQAALAASQSTLAVTLSALVATQASVAATLAVATQARDSAAQATVVSQSSMVALQTTLNVTSILAQLSAVKTCNAAGLVLGPAGVCITAVSGGAAGTCGGNVSGTAALVPQCSSAGFAPVSVSQPTCAAAGQQPYPTLSLIHI